MQVPRLRRLFQFGLGTLFVALTILCIALGITANRVRQQKMAVAAILKAGGRVTYTRTILIESRVYPNSKAPPRGQLQVWLGDDWFESVSGVTLYGEGCNDTTLEHLKKLPGLKNVALWAWSQAPQGGPSGGTSVPAPLAGITDEGMKIIATLPDLNHMSLTGNRVSDIGLEYLQHHPTLRSVQLNPDSSNATANDIKALMDTLPNSNYKP